MDLIAAFKLEKKIDNLSINFIGVHGLGNIILYLPLIKKIKKNHEVYLTIIVKNKNTKKIINTLGIFDNIFEANEIFDLRNTKFSICIDLYPSGLRGNLISLLLKSEIKITVRESGLIPNLKKCNFKFLHNFSYVRNKHDHDLISVSRSLVYDLCINEYLNEFGGSVAIKSNIIILHFNASVSFKKIENSEIVNLINGLLSLGKTVIYAGADFEIKNDFKIIEQFKDNQNFKTYTVLDLQKFIELIITAECFIGLDSAYSHLAGICNVRSLVIWSVADINRIAPINQDLTLIYSSRINNLLVNKSYKNIDQEYVKTHMKNFKALNIIEILQNLRELEVSSFGNRLIKLFDVEGINNEKK